MEYVTQGKKIHTDMIIDLFTKEKEVLAESCESSLRIILVEEGSLVLDFKGKPIFVESPALICLDNKVVLQAGMASQNHFPTIYFKPAVINSLFSYAFLETMDHDSLSQTEQQDIFWLHPFLSQESQGLTYVKLGPESMQRVKTLFSKMHKELNEQPDWLWPCRSRSIFLEFLYYMVSILQRYEEFKHEQLSSEDLFTQIQFYLHNHFQEDLSLEEVASRFHTNRTSLNTLFC